MKKIILLILLTISISILNSQKQLMGLNIKFYHDNTATLGITPFMRNVMDMYDYTLEQAAIYGARLERSLCVYGSANIDIDNENYTTTQTQTASYTVTVVDDWDILEEYLEYLMIVDEYEYNGYMIAFFDFDDVEPSLKITPYNNEPDIPNLKISKSGSSLKAIGVSKRRYLDEAFYDAFRLAMSEFSQYQNSTIKAMDKNFDEYVEDVSLITANNIISDVLFSELDIFYYPTSLGQFLVILTLEQVF
jgi:hypothetical protein